ncbi:peptidoglycan -binding protein [Sinirhodobacter ferrireducens]|uniref:Peptidoglycan-binding protein n=1 Tax=Paenirhodobacter ferrireducens TaxID=1215032 RepID=A0A443LP94_9RHOB|nr:peptidoglycan -binding protein [Sinirhodobacter ferrireducens]RWR50984.1 peptidoglycan -binding protein [Sinirhodobacter ferrireducens]
MALPRRGGARFSTNVWPGFVDAMGALLMVLIFVLSIFMIMQSMLRDTITSKENELTALTQQVNGLSQALSLERARAKDLAGQLDAAGQKITDFEAQVASLIAARDAAKADADASAAALKLDKATIEELRAKLKSSGDEVAAMTLALEAERQKAAETLTLLAAAQASEAELKQQLATQMTEAEKAAALRAVAEKALADQTQLSDRNAEKVALLNVQIAALRNQLGELQSVLDAAQARDAASKVQVETLGAQLNAALAQTAAEQKRRAELEAEARKKAEAEAQDLAKYRSEFFGRMSQLLQGREGVRIVGDRFVFSSEVLFQLGSADLSPEGKAQIARVAETFRELASDIPPTISWILEVDGFTDDTPLSGQGAFRDNWELSQARALSVVRYLIDDLGFPPRRLAATGFGQYQPVVGGTSETARAQNRRIELKLTER